uniref:Ribosomal protein eL8/eL30/eS12/Gadd45 domain-containing protein n=1 Tax=Sphenodon punctatus TaxID=8508 RepID=A0A8D0HSF1_SPHPU
MAMPVVPAGKGSARKAKQIAVKTSLNNPYAIKWHTLEGEDMQFILQTLEEGMKHIGFKKNETPKRKKRPTAKKPMEEKCHVSGRKCQRENEVEDTQEQGWTDTNTRKQLAIGINEVTRALERNILLLVLVCKSAKPAMITSHLIQLSASRAVPACQVPRLSESIAPILGLTSVLALGFKKNSDTFTEVVETIIPRVPVLDISWIHHGTEQSMLSEDTEPIETQHVELMETEVKELSQSHKRKRTESNRLLSSNISLQSLKIKKLVPNPNKIRKPPKSKKSVSK